jgi:hypothetical protein
MTKYWICTTHSLRFSDKDEALSHRQDQIKNGDNTCCLGVRNTSGTIQGIPLDEFETTDSSFSELELTQDPNYSRPENSQEVILDQSESIDFISPEL